MEQSIRQNGKIASTPLPGIEATLAEGPGLIPGQGMLAIFFSVSPNVLLHFFFINILPFRRSGVKITKK